MYEYLLKSLAKYDIKIMSKNSNDSYEPSFRNNNMGKQSN